MSSESGSSSGAQLAKNFSRISLLGLAFITLNSWTAFSSALPLSLTSGGPTSIIWGLLTAGVCTLCIAASLAEFLSAYPTAAGRYRWVAAVSWDDYERVLSWFTAWANVAAWICLCATASLFGSQLVTNTVILVHPVKQHPSLSVLLPLILLSSRILTSSDGTCFSSMSAST